MPTGPLVGRDFELTVLERTMDGLREGRGVIVSVIGEAGIGKTRLVNEVRSEYTDVIRFIEGRAVSYAQSFPYSPIRDLLRDWLRVGASTPETRVRLELKAQLAELFGDEADDAYSFLANLLGLTLEPDEAEKIRELNRESVQHQTIEVFADLLYRLSEEQPLCVVLEDLHWADESTLELLEETLRVTEESAIGLVFLYRTEREHRSWRLGERARQLHPHRYREIELRPLPSDASKMLVDRTADGELPEAVSDLLVERAGGNPFFLEEALRDLVERGALTRSNGAWKLAVGQDDLAVPGARPGRAPGPARPARAGYPRGGRPRRGDRAHVRAAAPREARPPRPAARRAPRAPAPRPDRGEAAPPGSRIPVPPRARPGGGLRDARRADPPRPAPARGRGARGSVQGLARGGVRAPRAPLQRGGRAGEGGRVPARGRRRRPADLRRPGGARALPQGPRVPRPPRRRAPRARHALQDGARLPPGLGLRERGEDLRRGVLLPGRGSHDATSSPPASRPRRSRPTRSPRATSTRPRAASSSRTSSRGSWSSTAS